MGLFNGGNLAPVPMGEQHVAEKSIGPGRRSIVKTVCPEELILVGNVLVSSDG